MRTFRHNSSYGILIKSFKIKLMFSISVHHYKLLQLFNNDFDMKIYFLSTLITRYNLLSGYK